MNLLNIYDISLLLLALALPMGLGYATRLSKLLGQTDGSSIGKFVILISVPFLIFKSLYKANIESLAQVFPAVSANFLLNIIYAVCCYYLAQYITTGKDQQSAFSFTVFAGNYIFLGWGVMDSFYGTEALTRAVYFTLLSWPVFMLCGFGLIYLNNRFSGVKTSRRSFLKIMLKNSLFPLTAAFLGIGCNLFHVSVPSVLWDFIDKFAGVTIPMILFTIGLNFKLRMPRNRFKIVLAGSFIRLIGGSVLGIIIVLIVRCLFPVDLLTQKVIFLEAVMPAATMTIFFAQYTPIDNELQAGIITFSTLFSLITIPVWYAVLEYFFSLGWF